METFSKENRTIYSMPDLGKGVSALDLNLSLDADYDYDVKDLNLMTLLMTEGICEHTFILSVRTVW